MEDSAMFSVNVPSMGRHHMVSERGIRIDHLGRIPSMT